MMENLFESSLLMVTLTAFPFAFFLGNNIAKKAPMTEQSLFDKAKMKYTDGEAT